MANQLAYHTIERAAATVALNKRLAAADCQEHAIACIAYQLQTVHHKLQAKMPDSPLQAIEILLVALPSRTLHHTKGSQVSHAFVGCP